jgi:hypothetical protein
MDEHRSSLLSPSALNEPNHLAYAPHSVIFLSDAGSLRKDMHRQKLPLCYL